MFGGVRNANKILYILELDFHYAKTIGAWGTLFWPKLVGGITFLTAKN